MAPVTPARRPIGRYLVPFALMAVLGISGHCSPDLASEPDRQLQGFWTTFRAAALAGNAEALGGLTRFPLEVRGPTDAEPVLTLDRTRLATAMARLLDEPILSLKQGRLEQSTLRQVLESTPQLGARHAVGRTTVRVESLQFERIDGAWRLSRVYTDDPRALAGARGR